MKRWIALLALTSGCLSAAPVAAQSVALDSACFRPLAAAVDSLGKAHLPSTQTTLYQRRAITTLTAAHVLHCTRVVGPPPPPVVDSVEIGFDYTTRPLWPLGLGTLPASGTMPLCATVTIRGVTHLASTAVQIAYIRPDSLAMTLRPEGDGTGIRDLCHLWLPPGTPDPVPVWPVRWRLVQVQVAEGLAWAPVAEPVLP